ncbi:MAG: antitoxin AF2212-like protein [Verrucomicrobiota bacterium]
MSTTLGAVYEQGWFKPLKPLSSPEHSRVPLTFEVAEDEGPREWRLHSERSLMPVWDNPADDVFHVLLKK